MQSGVHLEVVNAGSASRSARPPCRAATGGHMAGATSRWPRGAPPTSCSERHALSTHSLSKRVRKTVSHRAKLCKPAKGRYPPESRWRETEGELSYALTDFEGTGAILRIGIESADDANTRAVVVVADVVIGEIRSEPGVQSPARPTDRSTRLSWPSASPARVGGPPGPNTSRSTTCPMSQESRRLGLGVLRRDRVTRRIAAPSRPSRAERRTIRVVYAERMPEKHVAQG